MALHPRLTVVIGGNGAGKTTIAECLGALSGDREVFDELPERRESAAGRVSLWSGRTELASWTRGEPRRPYPGLLLAYGRYRRVPPLEDDRYAMAQQLLPTASRRQREWRIHPRDLAEGPRATTLSTPNGDLLSNVERVLAFYANEWLTNGRGKATFEQLALSIATVGTDSGVERVEARFDDADVPEAVVVRRGVQIPFRNLSDGYQAMLVVVVDLLTRLEQVEHGRESPALVVIDEVDLHLHPRWTRGVVGQLTSLFPNVQFVLTTHSPAVVQSAIDQGYGVVRLTEKRSGTVAKKIGPKRQKELDGSGVGTLLTQGDLFSVDSRYSPTYERLEQEVGALRRRVEEGEASARDRNDLIKKLHELEALLVDEASRNETIALLAESAKAQVAFTTALKGLVANKPKPATARRAASLSARRSERKGA